MSAAKAIGRSRRRHGAERADTKTKAISTFEDLVAAGFEPRDFIQFTNHILGLAVSYLEDDGAK